MNQPISLSDEMNQYMSKGTCPRCGVVILSPEYIRQHDAAMRAAVLSNWSKGPILRSIVPMLATDALTPAGAIVARSRGDELQCLTCQKSWNFYRTSNLNPAQRFTSQYGTPGIAGYKRQAFGQPAVPNYTAAFRGLSTPAATTINVAGYRLKSIKDEQQIEAVLRTEKKTYPNNSKGRVTPKVSLTDSVTRSVTIESNSVKASGGQAGIQILGFAAIQGQIQQQLSQRNAVQTQQTLTFSEEIQVEVPPHSTIELTITWKLIWLKGTAILGPLVGLARVEVPYFVPHRLTFDWSTRDVPLTKQRNK